MSRAVCGVCFCPYGDEGDCACSTETHYKKVIDDVQALFDAKREQPAQPIRWDSNAVGMTGAMATLPKSGSESVVDYKPVISDAGADANIPAIPGTYYGIVLKGTGKITVTNGVQRKPWVELTDEEIEELAKWADKNGAPWHLEFARAIEAKLKAKNSL